jgi:hypothetical protein
MAILFGCNNVRLLGCSGPVIQLRFSVIGFELLRLRCRLRTLGSMNSVYKGASGDNIADLHTLNMTSIRMQSYSELNVAGNICLNCLGFDLPDFFISGGALPEHVLMIGGDYMLQTCLRVTDPSPTPPTADSSRQGHKREKILFLSESLIN